MDDFETITSYCRSDEICAPWLIMENSNWMECPYKSKKLRWLPTVQDSYWHKSRICQFCWAEPWKSFHLEGEFLDIFHLEGEFLYSFVQFVDKLVTGSVKSNLVWVNWKCHEGKTIHVFLFFIFLGLKLIYVFGQSPQERVLTSVQRVVNSWYRGREVHLWCNL